MATIPSGQSAERLMEELDIAMQSLISDDRSHFDARVFRKLYQQFLLEPGTIDWDRMHLLADDVQIKYEQLAECSVVGDETSLVTGRLCMVKLNGGLGTTMGCQSPKSLIIAHDQDTFLDFAVKHNRVFNEQHNCSVPLILMNSFSTDQPIREALDSRQLKIRTFLQSKCPRLDARTLLPVPKSIDDPESEAWYPPGHGNVLQSMAYTGLLDDLLAEGRDICFISNVDNTCATIDLKIAKYMCDSDVAYLMECTEKTPIDQKGGTLIEIDDHIMHLEMPQVPADHIKDFCSTELFKIFNTNNIWVNLRSLKAKVDQLKMEIIVNRKILKNGEKVIQLETSIGGAIRNFQNAKCLIVPRSRFLPVKNTQDLLAINSDVYEVTDQCSLRLSPERSSVQPPVIELSEHFRKIDRFYERFRFIPHLKHLEHLRIAGDVFFGENVTLKGTVIIDAAGEKLLRVLDNTILENQKVNKS